MHDFRAVRARALSTMLARNVAALYVMELILLFDKQHYNTTFKLPPRCLQASITNWLLREILFHKE